MSRFAFLLVAVMALPVGAQTLTWETVGVEPTRSAGPPSLLSDGSLLLGGKAFPESEASITGLLRLNAPHGPGQEWESAYPYDFDQDDDPVVSFGPDTLFTYFDTSPARSIDGGTTFEPLPAPAECGASQMIEIPAGLLHAGRLLCGNSVGDDAAGYVTYSDDRGDSWTRAFGPPNTPDPSADHLEVVRSGPHTGRILAAGRWGLATSDDGGTTWQPSEIWQYVGYYGNGLGTLAGAAPGGGDRIVALVNDPSGDHNALFVSDDGDLWTQIFSFGGNPTDASFVDLGGGSAFVVFEHGNVRRTEDGGASWVDMGIVPFSLVSGMGSAVGRAKWAWQGPDGRLYVGGSALGEGGTSLTGYTWRTVEPLAVAGEAAPETGAVGVTVSPNPSRGAMTARVTQDSPSADVTVEVWDAVGRRVAVLHEGVAPGSGSGAGSGELSLDVDTSGFAVGVYRVVVMSGGERAQTAFTVAR